MSLMLLHGMASIQGEPEGGERELKPTPTVEEVSRGGGRAARAFQEVSLRDTVLSDTGVPLTLACCVG